ncbi:MAG TPA: hypothetical protein ENN01_01530 [Halothiobacillus sp.]|nr:hypothetical protein [Halothiobacillus sp.]
MQLIRQLEQETPVLAVIDPGTGHIAARFEGRELQALIECGELPLWELFDTSAKREHQLIRRLVLLACRANCRARAGQPCIATDCAWHPERQANGARLSIDYASQHTQPPKATA